MKVTITPRLLKGTITPPPSKSQAHRLLIAAALAEGESRVSNVAFSQDISATLSCMEALGAKCRVEGDTVILRGIGSFRVPSGACMCGVPHLDCGESGSTLRFLIPVALAVTGGGIFTGRGRLMQRPQQPYADLFREKNIFFAQEAGAITAGGELKPGEYALPGDVSSQFVTGLLYALPLLEGDSVIRLTTPLESAGYVDMTLLALEEFGIKVEVGDGWYRIPGGQKYQAKDVVVESDYSQAAFYYAAIGLGSDVEIQGLNPFSAQGDMRIVPYYLKLSQPGKVELDVSQCPDLVPALAAHAALRAGEVTYIVNAARLRIKESDRLAAVTEELNRLGAKIEEYPDSLTIHGVDHLTGGAADAHNDHRIAMMLAVAATRAEGEVTITGAESVSKSYPNFWEDYEALGGMIRREA